MARSEERSRSLFLRLFLGVCILAVLGFFVLTSPWTWSLVHPSREVASIEGADLENGEFIFLAGDCATCHATPGQEDPLVLGGGRELDTEFGLFRMPNISPHDEDGIGDWTLAEFDRAVREGVGPGGLDGENFYPSFPYTSYQRMTAEDVRDMYAFIQSLEPVAGRIDDHDLKFPYNIRRGVGLWRLVFLDGERLPEGNPGPLPVAEDANDPFAPVTIDAPDDVILARGKYLVEGPGHCAECHSPRTMLGTIPAGMRHGGGPTPEGHGHFPNISPHETGIGFWSANAIANYLKTGVSPIGKRAGGDMEEVVANTSQLSDADRLAMARYLKTVAPVDNPAPGLPEPNRSSQVVMLEQSGESARELPTSPAEEVGVASSAFVVHTKSFFLDAGGAEEDGKLLSGTEVAVVEEGGDLLRVRLDGWQLVGAEAVLYAKQGQRIMQAVLGEPAIAALETGETVTDPDTGQDWVSVSLEGWVDKTGMLVDGDALWSFTAQMFNSACAACHSPPEADHFLANQWIGTLGSMKRFTSLEPDAYRLLLVYLQNNAKDSGAKERADL
ncbi:MULTISPECIES: c-type cytochrome [Rhodovulum]|uniref:Mono/diheme cytochrome c family protein n=2 Tax=Rhodovulum TaxID=34008 RepID=A0A4R2PS53_9RHOB|nr:MULTISPECIES: c-type cytochrome [Rhodovulum]TCP38597.1 mono/diheme cytochrome c family protein [Rhodovulum marinum]TDX24698.1 mono/diheme cytochrome c family protein [Rhodovulum visakhapatnamense]